MTDDPFESELDGLFAQTPDFDDSEAFARAVERRLEPAPEPARASRLRWIVLGGAALVGGGLSLRSVEAAVDNGAPAFEKAQSSLFDWSASLNSALSDVSAGAAGSPLWIMVGVGAVVVAGLLTLQEV